MTALKALRNQIRSLLRRRRVARFVTGWCALLLAGTCLMLGLFLIDVLFEMTQLQRLIALLAVAGVLAWVVYRYVRPWLVHKEDEIDVALRVQSRRQIDSDLVAALQFELPAAATWGSPQLERAVVQQVAEGTRRWNLSGDLPQRGLRRRLAFLVASLAVIAVIPMFFPGHSAIFLNRLAFGSGLYPRNTLILDVWVNDQRLKEAIGSPGEVPCRFGQPAEFRIVCDGKLPREGEITIRPVGEGAASVIPVKPVENGSCTYTGRYDKLDTTFDFVVSVGDARRKLGRVNVSPPPVVQVTFKQNMPDYAVAVGVQPDKVDPFKREFLVRQYSNVDLEVRCLNKGLKQVTLVVEKKKYPQGQGPDNSPKQVEPVVEKEECLLQKVGSDGLLWKLPNRKTPFTEITEPVEYSIEVIDLDELKPVNPIKGKIQVKPDEPPSLVEADVANRKEVAVLPTAKPRVRYRIEDDYGVGGLTMEITVRRGLNGPVVKRQAFAIPIRESKDSAPFTRSPLAGVFRFDLAGFELSKRDFVEIVLKATDYRGGRPGCSKDSEPPVILMVEDHIGILEALTKEMDVESEGRIRKIINTTTGAETTKQTTGQTTNQRTKP